MATVGEVAVQLSVSDQTIRTWASEFAGYLSPGATPPRGEPRNFNREDLGVLALVVAMRQQQATYESIHEALRSGQRGQVPLDATAPPEAPGMSGALVTRLMGTLARTEGELSTVREERDYLRGQLTAAQAAQREAEGRAVAAETELRLRRQLEEERSKQVKPPPALEG